MPDVGKELAALDFGNLIGGPLNAVITAQSRAAQSTADFIKTVGFYPADQPEAADGTILAGTPVYVDFKYPKEITPFIPAIGKDGDVFVPPYVAAKVAVPNIFINAITDIGITLDASVLTKATGTGFKTEWVGRTITGTTTKIASVVAGGGEMTFSAALTTGTIKISLDKSVFKPEWVGRKITGTSPPVTIETVAEDGSEMTYSAQLTEGVSKIDLAAEAIVGQIGLPNGQPAYVPAVAGQYQEMKFSVPILTMLPIPFIKVDIITIDFNAKITSMETQSSSEDISGAASFEAKQRWPGGSAKLNVSAAYKKSTSSGSNVERTYSMAIHVQASQDEMPAGMEKLLGILENAMISTAGPLRLKNS